jgi:hypothetical protein
MYNYYSHILPINHRATFLHILRSLCAIVSVAVTPGVAGLTGANAHQALILKKFDNSIIWSYFTSRFSLYGLLYGESSLPWLKTSLPNSAPLQIQVADAFFVMPDVSSYRPEDIEVVIEVFLTDVTTRNTVEI